MASYEEFRKAAETQSQFEKFKAAAEPRPVRDAAMGAATGLNRTIGGAVDIAMSPVAMAREAVTGKRAGGMQSLFPEAANTAGRIGQMVGQAAGAAMLGGAGAMSVPAAAPVSGGRAAIQNFLNTIGVTFRNAPGRFVGAEALAGGTAEAGGEIAKTQFPDSDAARFVGEILGGMAPAAIGQAPSAVMAGVNALPVSGSAVRGVKNVADQVSNLRNPLSQRNRAVSRVERATAAPEQAAGRMDEELLPGLTPAARTGDRGLLALEASANQSLPDSEQFIQKSVEATNANIQQAIKQFYAAPPEATAKAFEQAQDSLKKSLDARLAVAARNTQQTLEEMSPRASREAVNRVAATELRSALQSARTEERRLYELIPEDAIVPTQKTVETYRELMGQLSTSQADDMPVIVSDMLMAAPATRSTTINPATGQSTTTTSQGAIKLGQQTTIKEMRGLQSKLRQISRNARSGDNANLNRARIADDLADAITEDIANTQGGENVAQLVKTAVDYSRELNEKFRKGTVGVLLGLAKQGEPRVPEGLVLESSIGIAGPKAREAFDDMVTATSTPEVHAAMEDYIKNRFFDYAVVNNQVSPERLQTFLRGNKELLGRMPKVQADFERLAQSMDIRDLRMAQRGRVSFDKPSLSRATMFIQRGPESAIRSVLESRYPQREMRNLTNMARRDRTGEAEQGLKTAFSEYIAGKSTRGGEISGQAMNDFLSDPKTLSAMRGIYTPGEIRRWETIARTAQRLDLQKQAKPSAEGVLGDQPGETATMLARLLGAAYGRTVGQRVGAGGTVQIPGIFSDKFASLLQKGIDPAKQLLIDAVQDEKLFRELLMARVTPKNELPEQAKRRLNAWLATLPQDEEQE